MWEQSLVTIRERRFGDILDLALHVLRDNALAILFWGLLGILPFALLNYFLLPVEARSDIRGQEIEVTTTYALLYFWLVSWEIPLATSGITLLLGQRMFRPRVHYGQMIRHWFGSLAQLIVLQGIVRGVLHLFCLGLFVPYLSWPYLNEVILLERNPLVSKKRMSTMSRSIQLHRLYFGELTVRWFHALWIGGVLCLSLTLGLGTLVALFRAQYPPLSWWLAGFFPAAAWITVVFMSVVRFLSYLDLRIRKEGWEIELQLKSEAARLTRAEGAMG